MRKRFFRFTVKMLLCMGIPMLMCIQGVAAKEDEAEAKKGSQPAQQAELRQREAIEHERAAQLGSKQRERGRRITKEQEEAARQAAKREQERIRPMEKAEQKKTEKLGNEQRSRGRQITEEQEKKARQIEQRAQAWIQKR